MKMQLKPVAFYYLIQISQTLNKQSLKILGMLIGFSRQIA